MNDFSSLQGLFEAAQRIQVEMVRVNAELAGKTVSAETGGGLVSCTANGKGDLTPGFAMHGDDGHGVDHAVDAYGEQVFGIFFAASEL